MINIKITGLDAVQRNLGELGRQVPFAASRALNKVGKILRNEIHDTMHRTFQGGATDWTRRAFTIHKRDYATKQSLAVTVSLRHDGAGKARSYDDTIRHLFDGGTRTFKRMEGAFRRIGVLPNGWMIVPGDACPLDGYGNPPKALIVQLISYFQAFGEQGYRANMTDKRKGKLAKRGVTERGYKTINGVEYFISRGRGQWFGGRSWMHGRHQHLHPGIWSRTSIHGVDVKPIFMFVRVGTWRKQIDLQSIGDRVRNEHWQREFNKELAHAIRTARRL